MAMAKQRLIKQIKSAFASTPYPGDDNIAPDPTGFDRETQAVDAHFRTVRWRQVDFEYLMRYAGDYSAVMSFMRPSAFRYYMPAFMLIVLTHYDDTDVLPESLVFRMTLPDKSDELYDHVHKRLTRFSPEEARAIRGFLEFMASAHGEELEEDAKLALVSYWIERTRP